MSLVQQLRLACLEGQVVLYPSSMKDPFSDPSTYGVDQGFVLREKSLTIYTPADSGEYIIDVMIVDDIPEESNLDNVERFVIVPNNMGCEDILISSIWKNLIIKNDKAIKTVAWQFALGKNSMKIWLCAASHEARQVKVGGGMRKTDRLILIGSPA